MRKPHLLEGRGYVLSGYIWGNMYLHYALGDWDCLVSQALINLCLQNYTDELLLFTTKWCGLRTLFFLLDWKSLSAFCALYVYLVCVLWNTLQMFALQIVSFIVNLFMLSWFNPSLQLSTTDPLAQSPWWDGRKN